MYFSHVCIAQLSVNKVLFLRFESSKLIRKKGLSNEYSTPHTPSPPPVGDREPLPILPMPLCGLSPTKGGGRSPQFPCLPPGVGLSHNDLGRSPPKAVPSETIHCQDSTAYVNHYLLKKRRLKILKIVYAQLCAMRKPHPKS